MVLTTQFKDTYTFLLTYYISAFANSVTLDPRNSFYHFECTLSYYFNDVYFADILIELILPYLDALVLILIWYFKYRN